MLTSRQRAFLKSLAHDKKPVILLGHKGITDSVVKETASALLTHELIKVRLHEEDTLDDDAKGIAKRAGADLVARVGKMAILYKKHPEEPKIRLPRAAKKGTTLD